MIFRPRVIPTLLIDNERLVKTTKFQHSHYLGDPINAIKIFNEKRVDELCILDITATKQNREPNFELLECMAEEAFMPLSYGGGIRLEAHAKKLFYIGFEKIIMNTILEESPQLLRFLSKKYGSQSIVASIDYKNGKWGKKCYIRDGTKKIRNSPVELCKKAEQLGAGEILLYAMDKDGMMNGYDKETILDISKELNIPIIACGGAGHISDIKSALDNGASAVAAGSIFVYYGKHRAVLINYPDERDFINANIYKEYIK